MTVSEFETLDCLRRLGARAAEDIAEDLYPLGTTRGYAAKLRELEKRGLVMHDDQRPPEWDLTLKGWSILNA